MQQDIHDIIYQILNVDINDYDENLLSEHWNIDLVDWLYVFAELEKKYSDAVYDLFAENTYKIFTINNLAREIENIISHNNM